VSSESPSTTTLMARPRHSRAGSTLLNIVAVVGLPAVIITIWWLSSAGSTNYLNPPLAKIVEVFVPTWVAPDANGQSLLAKDVLPGLTRFLIGYLSALVVGIVLGLAVGSNARLRAFCEPVLEFFRAVPPSILVPIFMLFLGIGDNLRIAAIAFGAVWPVLLNTVEGVRAIDPVLDDTASSYRLRRRTRLFRIILPAASPQIVTGARQALPIAIIMMVISEMFAARDGLGAAIVVFQKSFAIPQMWGGVLLLGVIGVLFAVILKLVTDPLLSWYRGYLRAQRGS
jgi:ABC-type nitrate/sulfonate/bicarbonate transport system permease component